jgi:hypothetical protein
MATNWNSNLESVSFATTVAMPVHMWAFELSLGRCYFKIMLCFSHQMMNNEVLIQTEANIYSIYYTGLGNSNIIIVYAYIEIRETCSGK